MIAASTCLGLHIECQTVLKGGLGTIVAFVLFVGSILLVLSAVFGRRMGYLVLAVSFFSWMILFSALWTFGFWSQGPKTPVNLGPRGAEPSWVPLDVGLGALTAKYPEFQSYPGPPWKTPAPHPSPDMSASIQSATSAIQSFLAEEANAKLGLEPTAPGALATTDFTVQNLAFATHDKVSLAAAQAFYNGGGPLLTVYAYHDSGSVPHYSWMFLIGSVVGLAVHLPFLDRAEKKRKEILTGGAPPPWYGPA